MLSFLTLEIFNICLSKLTSRKTEVRYHIVECCAGAGK